MDICLKCTDYYQERKLTLLVCLSLLRLHLYPLLDRLYWAVTYVVRTRRKKKFEGLAIPGKRGGYIAGYNVGTVIGKTAFVYALYETRFW